MARSVNRPLNAFCVDLEEWFHVCGVTTPYSNPNSWSSAPSFVDRDTSVLKRLLDETGARGTFLVVGWVAERYPKLIKWLADAGHEIGCHGYYHRLIFDSSHDEFRQDMVRCLTLLRDISGQPVNTYRAPGFSMRRQCFWAYPILRELGITIDVSIVPAAREHGGISGFTRDPFLLHTDTGDLKVFPVSVMKVLGRTTPFSGGGYLRLFPVPLIKYGYRQNHAEGRPVMSYIHPREINIDQPRLTLSWAKYFKYYVGIRSAESKLRKMLQAFEFTTVSDVIANIKHFPKYNLKNGNIVPA